MAQGISGALAIGLVEGYASQDAGEIISAVINEFFPDDEATFS